MPLGVVGINHDVEGGVLALVSGQPEAAATGAEFVALHEAVWSHRGGPAEAVRLARGMLAGRREPAA